MSLQVLVSDSALTVGLSTSKRGKEVVWEEIISLQSVDVAKYLSIIFGKCIHIKIFYIRYVPP